MIKEYDVVRLEKLNHKIPILIGTIGVVLIVYNNNPIELEVEFIDKKKQSLGNYTVNSDSISLVN